MVGTEPMERVGALTLKLGIPKAGGCSAEPAWSPGVHGSLSSGSSLPDDAGRTVTKMILTSLGFCKCIDF